MNTSDFTFELPENLIAQYPPAERGQSRLMVMYRKQRRFEHRMVRELPSIIEPGTLMVFNNSRVRRSRIIGLSEATGAKAEFLLLKKLDDLSWQVISKRSKRRRPGSRYVFDDAGAEISSVASDSGAEGNLILRFDHPIDDTWLDIHGHVPLPPYIRRKDSSEDGERYQTVYAKEYGSAAAPTAGLHFTEELLGELGNAGIETVFVTLHVGLGTFLPVRTEKVEDHLMHEEVYSISDETACRIEKARAEGRKVLAVGTTSVRTLESAWIADPDSPGRGRLRRGEGSTSIFIYPGYTFKVVDALFTNFHTPGSTLLMLVSAFASTNTDALTSPNADAFASPNADAFGGRDFILESYREAVKEGYRFFSYGDACLIL